jgi:glycosyltransferase involved in cell wall biosynthesis
MQLPVLLVFSHLRWGFVYQRPQHLLSRLAGRWRVLFVEEPVQAEGAARLAVSEVSPELTVLTPHTPVAAPGFHDNQIAVLQQLLQDHVDAQGLHVDVAWLYTPMALPLAHALHADCLVYDCMDELSAFRGAPLQLRQRESALMQQAALVLTGGPSLFEARKHQHTNIHCFRSAVDAEHFAPANLVHGSAEEARAQALQSHLPRPRLGFFGVVDERMDLDLIATLAQCHPEWSLVMVGPVVKIDPASLPRQPNIHWLGMQPYEQLPWLLAGWDLALMPFALNESTRFISPTKTLEYMAGQLPVVSTPIHDVLALYTPEVVVAPAGDAFVQACEAMLAEGTTARRARQAGMARLVAQNSWNDTADAIHVLLAEALEGVREALADEAPESEPMPLVASA